MSPPTKAATPALPCHSHFAVTASCSSRRTPRDMINMVWRWVATGGSRVCVLELGDLASWKRVMTKAPRTIPAAGLRQFKFKINMESQPQSNQSWQQGPNTPSRGKPRRFMPEIRSRPTLTQGKHRCLGGQRYHLTPILAGFTLFWPGLSVF